MILDADAINVAPLNHLTGAVVSLMERSNVETVIVAGKVRKWKGRLLDVNLNRLRRDIEASRDGVPVLLRQYLMFLQSLLIHLKIVWISYFFFGLDWIEY